MKLLTGILVSIFGTLGIGATVIAKANYPTLAGWSAHLWAAAALSPFILGAAFAVSRRNHTSIVSGFSRLFIFGWVGFIGLIGGGVEYANGRLDSSPGVKHSVAVASKHITNGKKSKSYSVRVSSWRNGGGTEEVTVSKQLFESIEPGSSTLEVTSHNGALGMEWIEPIRG